MRPPSKKASGTWRAPRGYKTMSFVAFTIARQKLFAARRAGKPSAEWTDDPILQNAKFCNIDRRDDAVTVELLEMLEPIALRERVLLAAALRFTGSRRGEAATLARLIEEGQHLKDRSGTPLRAALQAEDIKCGVGTYQMSLNRKQVATCIETMAAKVVEHVQTMGPFVDVLEASDFVAECMTVGKRPQFSANETAKDFAYIGGLLQPAAHHRCRLGPGARKGLCLVKEADGALGKLGDEGAVSKLQDDLRAAEPRLLEWIEAIDVEQALCEYAKYRAYISEGVSPMKRYTPTATPP